MVTLYDLKPRFQGFLRPTANRLATRGVTANQVTVAATILSLGAGAVLAWLADPRLFLILPVVLLVRMALNAIDGMIAREHGQESRLGMFLNEIGDVGSDVALILPFAAIGFSVWGVVAFAFAAVMSEFAGVLAVMAGGGRRYDGPMGKSDRALALGVLGALAGFGVSLPAGVAALVFPALALAALLSMVNRVKGALK